MLVLKHEAEGGDAYIIPPARRRSCFDAYEITENGEIQTAVSSEGRIFCDQKKVSVQMQNILTAVLWTVAGGYLHSGPGVGEA